MIPYFNCLLLITLLFCLFCIGVYFGCCVLVCVPLILYCLVIFSLMFWA